MWGGSVYDITITSVYGGNDPEAPNIPHTVRVQYIYTLYIYCTVQYIRTGVGVRQGLLKNDIKYRG